MQRISQCAVVGLLIAFTVIVAGAIAMATQRFIVRRELRAIYRVPGRHVLALVSVSAAWLRAAPDAGRRCHGCGLTQYWFSAVIASPRDRADVTICNCYHQRWLSARQPDQHRRARCCAGISSSCSLHSELSASTGRQRRAGARDIVSLLFFSSPSSGAWSERRYLTYRHEYGPVVSDTRE